MCKKYALSMHCMRMREANPGTVIIIQPNTQAHKINLDQTHIQYAAIAINLNTMAVPLSIKLVRLSDDLLPNSLRTYGNEPHKNHESLKKTTKDGGCKGDSDDGETTRAVGVSLMSLSADRAALRHAHSTAQVVRITSCLSTSISKPIP